MIVLSSLSFHNRCPISQDRESVRSICTIAICTIDTTWYCKCMKWWILTSAIDIDISISDRLLFVVIVFVVQFVVVVVIVFEKGGEKRKKVSCVMSSRTSYSTFVLYLVLVVLVFVSWRQKNRGQFSKSPRFWNFLSFLFFHNTCFTFCCSWHAVVCHCCCFLFLFCSWYLMLSYLFSHPYTLSQNYCYFLLIGCAIYLNISKCCLVLAWFFNHPKPILLPILFHVNINQLMIYCISFLIWWCLSVCCNFVELFIDC